MEYTIDKQGDINVVNLSGNIFTDAQTQEIQEEVLALIEEGEINYILDLKDMKFVNSIGLSLLLTLLTKARKGGGDLLLINVSDQLTKLLMITKLGAVFQIEDDFAAAQTHFANASN